MYKNIDSYMQMVGHFLQNLALTLRPFFPASDTGGEELPIEEGYLTNLPQRVA